MGLELGWQVTLALKAGEAPACRLGGTSNWAGTWLALSTSEVRQIWCCIRRTERVRLLVQIREYAVYILGSNALTEPVSTSPARHHMDWYHRL